MRVDTLHDLFNLCFPEKKQTQKSLQALLNHHAAHLIQDDHVFLIAYVVPPEAEILFIGVHPEARRQGLAQKMLATLKSKASVVTLDVAEDNLAAIRLYEKAGFSKINTRKGYFAREGCPNIDAIVMQWADEPTKS